MCAVTCLPAIQVDLTRVQLDILLLIKDAVDDGLQHLVQIWHANSLTAKQQQQQQHMCVCAAGRPRCMWNVRATTAHSQRQMKIASLTFMNCSMALEASELERNKVFGSAGGAEQKKEESKTKTEQ